MVRPGSRDAGCGDGAADSSIANVALPAIGRGFHTAVDGTEWVLIAYMLTTSSTLVLFGRLGDMWGQKRVYMLGFIVFGLSSLACAFAPSFLALCGRTRGPGIRRRDAHVVDPRNHY